MPNPAKIKIHNKPFLSALNKTVPLSKAEQLFYAGMGSAAVFGILAVGSNAIHAAKSDARASLGEQTTPRVEQRIRSAYTHFLGGLASTAAMATYLFRSGVAHRVIRLNPVAYLLGGAFLTFTASIATQIVDIKKNPALKYSLWMLFNLSVALSLCPLGAFGANVLFKAAMGTACIFGAFSAIAIMSPSESFTNLRTFQGISLGVLLAASLGQIFFPSPLLTAVVIYGGLGIFSVFGIIDTKQIMNNSKNAVVFDPINNSMGIYLSVINIFVRMVFLMSNPSNKK